MKKIMLNNLTTHFFISKFEALGWGVGEWEFS